MIGLQDKPLVSQLTFCLHLEKYKRIITKMQFRHWWFTVALFLIQLIKHFICVEPITITLGAAAAGGSMLACKNIFWIFYSSFIRCVDRF